MKKRLLGLVLLTSFSLIATGCQSTAKPADKEVSSKSEKVYQSTDDFAKAVKKANKELTSTNMDTRLEVYQQKNTPFQVVKASGDVIYKGHDMNRMHMVLETETNGNQTSRQEIIVPTDSEAYVKQSATSDFTMSEITEANRDDYDLNPDYFDLLDYLYDNSDALALEEKADEYLVTIKDKDFSLIQTFGKEYNFTITGFTEDEAEKELTIHFDKKTLFMTSFQASLTYDGKLGYVKLLGKTDYSLQNKISADEIKVPK